MKKQFYIKCSIALFCMISSFSGCKFVREIDVNIDDIAPSLEVEKTDSTIPITENPVTIVVEESGLIDEEAVLAYFYGMSRDELVEADCVMEEGDDEVLVGSIYHKDGIVVNYTYESIWNYNWFSMHESNDMVGVCYERVLEEKFLQNEISNSLTTLYPEGELEGCSREDAIAACAPLVEACGYKDAQVDVYVMKKDVLNNCKELAHMEDPQNPYPAPGEDDSAKWEEKDEAYFLVYRSVLNGRLLDTSKYMMYCVYVPERGRVVLAYARPPLVVTETLEETELISAEAAVEEVLRLLKVESQDDVTIVGISMVYSPRYAQVSEDLERKTIDPCWRIDYELPEEWFEKFYNLYYRDDGTILINAIDGQENKYSIY